MDLIIASSSGDFIIENFSFFFYTDYIIIAILTLHYITWLFLRNK